MEGKFVLLSGSASRSCESAKLATAIEFVQDFVREVLRRGGGIVVLAGDEESTKNDDGVPCVFDWVALRAVERYAESAIGYPRQYARVVMSDKTYESKIKGDNLKTLKNLEQRNCLKVSYIARAKFTGGEYRDLQSELSDAMLAIGGGKGTYNIGIKMNSLGKPVLPLDLQIGSFSEDGDGALNLHKEMMSNPKDFFPKMHTDIINKLTTFSLNSAVNEIDVVGQVAVELIAEELNSEVGEDRRTSKLKRITSSLNWKVVGVIAGGIATLIGAIAGLIKIFDFLA